MYKKFYWYRSGVTNTMKVALKDIFLKIKKMSLLEKGDTILDIGANDGTLLKYFKNSGFTTIGCEPAKNLTKELKLNSNYIINDFWKFKYLKNILDKYRLKKPKVITAIGMFYDLENPSKFISDAAKSLDDDGIFVAQLMCLNSMIKQNDLGNVLLNPASLSQIDVLPLSTTMYRLFGEFNYFVLSVGGPKFIKFRSEGKEDRKRFGLSASYAHVSLKEIPKCREPRLPSVCAGAQKLCLAL